MRKTISAAAFAFSTALAASGGVAAQMSASVGGSAYNDKTFVTTQPYRNTQVSDSATSVVGGQSHGVNCNGGTSTGGHGSNNSIVLHKSVVFPGYRMINTILGCSSDAALQANLVKYLPSQFAETKRVEIGCGVSLTSLFTGNLVLQRKATLDCATGNLTTPELPSQDGRTDEQRYYAKKALCLDLGHS